MNNALFEIETHTLISLARVELRKLPPETPEPIGTHVWVKMIQTHLHADFKLELLGLVSILEELTQRGVKKI